MFLLAVPNLYEIIGGAISIVIAIILIILLFKFFKGILKFFGGILILGLIVLAVLFFLGII